MPARGWRRGGAGGRHARRRADHSGRGAPCPGQQHRRGRAARGRPARKRGAPEPMAPRKSATMVSAPMHMPPKAAAVGMYRFSSFFRLDTVSRWPCQAGAGRRAERLGAAGAGVRSACARAAAGGGGGRGGGAAPPAQPPACTQAVRSRSLPSPAPSKAHRQEVLPVAQLQAAACHPSCTPADPPASSPPAHRQEVLPVAQLLGHVGRRLAADLDPGNGEDGADWGGWRVGRVG